ncbi:DOPA-like domain-containing protein [Cladochytrium replicatum]|nr:DOPA-like domain-containing protein [Cladochytrium replicatum]
MDRIFSLFCPTPVLSPATPWFKMPNAPETDPKSTFSASARADYEEEEIKEFHFHVYWFQNNPRSRAKAIAIRDEVLRLAEEGFWTIVPLVTVNDAPRGPHPVGSYEIWVPKEYFSKTYSWFLIHRPADVSVLIHPLTRLQRTDHDERAVWLGTPMPLDLDALPTDGDLPFQYPELGLGYSAPGPSS